MNERPKPDDDYEFYPDEVADEQCEHGVGFDESCEFCDEDYEDEMGIM